MKTRVLNTLLATGIGVLCYLADTFVYFLYSDTHPSFLASLFPSELSELISRLILFAPVSILSFLILKEIHRKRSGDISDNYPGKVNLGESLDYHFLSSLSFQLRTPLNAIIGFTELLKKSKIPSDTTDKYLKQISTSSEYLMLLANNLSEISIIERKEMSINKIKTDINRTIEEIYLLFQDNKKELGKEEIQLNYENVKFNEPLYIMTDPNRFRLVLNLLVENAFALSDSGTIYFGYHILEKGIIQFHVSSNAKGITTDQIMSILSRYNRLSDSRNLPFDSTFLHLAISKSIVKILGGEIWGTAGDTQGLTVYFTIPYETVPEVSVEIPEVKSYMQPESKDWSSKKLLVAEDMRSNFIYLQELLRPTNINILWATNGKQAIDMVKENPDIDLILMDILMPEMDGYEATVEIKKINNNIPVIAQTAYLIEHATRAEESKIFEAYLVKPIWAPQLITSMSKFI
jgi:signal transduction histidine kinase